MKQTLLDRAIGYISPKRAHTRLAYRAAMDTMLGYQASSKTRRTQSWQRLTGDANSVIRPHISDLRATARDLVRNNGWAARGVDVVINNTIGTGIIPHFNSSSENATARIEALMKAHLDTTDIDADGRHDLYGLQRLAFRTVVEAGEVLVRRRRRFVSDGLAMPFQLQVLEPDFLDHTKDGTAADTNNQIISGVEFDAIGRRVAYWLYDQHPGTTLRFNSRTQVSRRVAAEDVIHLYRMDRPGQVRGVTWLAPCVVKLNDFQDYDQAQLVRQKIAACFSVFVHDISGDVGTGPALGGDVSSSGDDLIEKVEPGLITVLPPTKDVKFATPPEVKDLEPYSRISLRAIAAPLGITYEALTGDLERVNFSSGRMGWLEMARNIDVNQSLLFIPGFCRRVEAWFMESLTIRMRIPTDAKWTWSIPRREMIDPTKEVPADIKAIRAGLKTRSDCLRERGQDPADVYDELQHDNQLADDRDLILDSDPRHVTQVGNAVEVESENDTQTDREQ